jgi:hypothetical protein
LPRSHTLVPENPRTDRRRRLDPRDAGAMIGQQHAGHRAGDAPRQVEHLDAAEDPAADRVA